MFKTLLQATEMLQRAQSLLVYPCPEQILTWQKTQQNFTEKLEIVVHVHTGNCQWVIRGFLKSLELPQAVVSIGSADPVVP